jgi:hypothetical protein
MGSAGQSQLLISSPKLDAFLALRYELHFASSKGSAMGNVQTF